MESVAGWVISYVQLIAQISTEYLVVKGKNPNLVVSNAETHSLTSRTSKFTASFCY